LVAASSAAASALTFAVLGSQACTSAGNCVAFGAFTDPSFNFQVMATTEVNGAWGPAGEIALPTDAAASPQLPRSARLHAQAPATASASDPTSMPPATGRQWW
jgi:hypothetical protein